MEESHKKFVENLTRIEAIRQAEADAIQYWGSDIPITILFAELGRAIVKNFDGLSHKDISYIFETIEQGMTSSDATLSTTVATGLLEAVSGQASKNTGIAKIIDNQLGEASRKYLTDWSNWHDYR